MKLRWTPFEKVIPAPRKEADLRAQANALGVSLDVIRREAERGLQQDTMYVNNLYAVTVSEAEGHPDFPPIIHLSIRRKDRAQVGKERYRDFMRIRDELVGDQHEAVELYPARVREIDTVNQYHLWVMKDPRHSFPVGWWAGRLVTSDFAGGAVQTPINPEHDWERLQKQLSFPFDNPVLS